MGILHSEADDVGRGAGDVWAAIDAATRGRGDCSTDVLVEYAHRLGRDPDLVGTDDEELVADLCRGAAALAAATCSWLVLLGEVVARGLWAVDGARTPATWLSWRLGIGPSTAREHVRVALRLRELPLVRERFASGTISYSKVRAISRVAGPSTERLLLRWADAATAAELEHIVRDTRRARAASGADAMRDDLGLHCRWRDDDTYEITIRLDAADGIVAEQRIERLVALAEAAEGRDVERTGQPDRGAGPGPPRSGRHVAADAVLGAMAAAVDAAATDTSGVDRHLAVVTLTGEDVVALADATDPVAVTASAAAAAGWASTTVTADRDGAAPRIVGTGRAGARRRPVPLRQLRRLLCATAIDVIAALDRPVDLGRTRRDPDARLRRLVHGRDRSCRMPGCGATRWLHVHHVVPWERGGPTDLDNLVLLCGFHHRLVHDAGWQLRPDGPGRWSFHPPDGPGGPRPRSVPPPMPLTAAVTAVLEDRARQQDERALLPAGYDGLGHDHDLTVEVLLDRLTAALPQEHPAGAGAVAST